MGHQINFYF